MGWGGVGNVVMSEGVGRFAARFPFLCYDVSLSLHVIFFPRPLLL